MTLTATLPCGCVIAVRIEGLRPEGDAEFRREFEGMGARVESVTWAEVDARGWPAKRCPHLGAA